MLRVGIQPGRSASNMRERRASGRGGDARRSASPPEVSVLPDIVAAESWGRATVNRIYADGRESDDITLEAPPANTQMYQPEIVSGRWLSPADTTGLVVNTDFLDDEPDLAVGDQVVLELNAKKSTWQIVGVVQGTMSGSTVYANQTYFERLSHNVGKASVVRFSTVDNSAMSARDFEEQFEQAGLDVTMVRTLADIQATLESSFNFLITFLLAMAVVLAAVGGLALSGTMSINVLERVREIGVMRAIGASDGAVLQLVLVEGVIIGLLSWLAGAILALPLRRGYR